MGFCGDKHGRVSVETRRESFKIHRGHTDDALGRTWQRFPHPEFENAELDDLIAALVEARARITGKATPQFRAVALTRAMVGARGDAGTGWSHWLRVGDDGGVSVELLRTSTFAGVDRFVGVERPEVGVEVASGAWLTATWCPLDRDRRIATWETPQEK